MFYDNKPVVTKLEQSFSTNQYACKIKMEITIPDKLTKASLNNAITEKLNAVFEFSEKEGIHKTIENLINRNRIYNNVDTN